MGLLIFTHWLRRWEKGKKLCANLNWTVRIYLQEWVSKGVPSWIFTPSPYHLIVIYFVWQRLKENFSRTVSPLTCFTMFSYVSWMTLAAFSCLFSPARNICAGGLINKTERWTFFFPFCHRSLFRVNKACFLVISIQTLNVRFQKRKFDVTLTLMSTLRTRYTSRKKTFWFAGCCKTGIVKWWR